MILLYRAANFFSRKKYALNGAMLIIAAPILFLYKIFTEVFMGYELPAATVIGRRFFIHHGYGIVINKHAVIGDDVHIRHGVTIGCKMNPDGSQGGSPIICDGVEIGAAAVIIGAIVIGKGAKIGAGTVVTFNVPPGACVVGSSGRIIE